MRVRFHLTLPQNLAQEPVIYRMGKEFELVTNIRRANIEDRLAWVILEVEGEEPTILEAVSWLIDQGVQVDRIDEDQER